MNKEPIITDDMVECAELMYSMDEGTLDFYQTSLLGFERKQFVYKDSQIVAENLYDDYGRIETSKKLMPDNVWEYKLFFTNGQPQIHTFYRTRDILLANDSFAKCWDQAIMNLRWSSSTLLRPVDCYQGELANDLYELYAFYNIAAYYNFKSYYENGKLKSEGSMVRKKGNELNYEAMGCEIGKYYEFDNHTLMDGTWNFYNEDGTLLKTINYDNGTEIK